MGSPGVKEDPCCAVASANGSCGLGCSEAPCLPQAPGANVCLEGTGEVRANGRNQSELGRTSDAPSEGAERGLC